MQYPSDWKRVIDVQNNAVRFFSPSDTGNVHVYSALEKQNRTLDQFTASHIIQEKQKSIDFNSIESSSTTLAGKEAHKLIYTYADSKGATVKAMEVYTITGNKIYMLHITPRQQPTTAIYQLSNK